MFLYPIVLFSVGLSQPLRSVTFDVIILVRAAFIAAPWLHVPGPPPPPLRAAPVTPHKRIAAIRTVNRYQNTARVNERPNFETGICCGMMNDTPAAPRA